MYFMNPEDFFSQVSVIPPLSREETRALGIRLASGDASAREALIRGHLPFVAACIRQRGPRNLQTLHTVYACMNALTKTVDSFDFTRENAHFIHALSRALRQCLTRCIAERP